MAKGRLLSGSPGKQVTKNKAKVTRNSAHPSVKGRSWYQTYQQYLLVLVQYTHQRYLLVVVITCLGRTPHLVVHTDINTWPLIRSQGGTVTQGTCELYNKRQQNNKPFINFIYFALNEDICDLYLLVYCAYCLVYIQCTLHCTPLYSGVGALLGHWPNQGGVFTMALMSGTT